MSNLKLPITRYYGSKRKLVALIWAEIEKTGIEFKSVLDVFGGTGIFSYYSKAKGKQVFYNDIFKFNFIIGQILIEKTTNKLTYNEAVELLYPREGIDYKSVIQNNYSGIYFTDEENYQIDIFVQNLLMLEDFNKQLSAYYIIFQSCIIKRPYNLFHRNNLNMRINFSGGNFGNKKTWERSFEELFLRFIQELDDFTFDNGFCNKSLNYSALELNVEADLIYLDPPYFNNKGHHTTYHSKYHFLEGLANYENLESNINYNKSNREILINKSSEFESSSKFLMDLEKLANNFPKSHIVISYRNNGFPSITEIEDLMIKIRGGKNVHNINLGTYGYALNKTNKENNEHLIICKLPSR